MNCLIVTGVITIFSMLINAEVAAARGVETRAAAKYEPRGRRLRQFQRLSQR